MTGNWGTGGLPLNPEEDNWGVEFKKTVLSIIESTGALTREQISQSKLLLSVWGPETDASAVVTYKGEGYIVRKIANENPQIFPPVRVFDTTGLEFNDATDRYKPYYGGGEYRDKNGELVYETTMISSYNDMESPDVTLIRGRGNKDTITTINPERIRFGGVFIEVKMPWGHDGLEISEKSIPIIVLTDEVSYIWSVYERIGLSGYKDTKPLARWDMLDGKWIIAPDLSKFDLMEHQWDEVKGKWIDVPIR